MEGISSEVRSAETSDLPGGESRRLRRRNRGALEHAHLDNCTVSKDSEKTSLGKEILLIAIAVTKVPPEL